MIRYFLIILSVITNIVLAQDADWERIDIDNSKLPNESIKCITIDSQGAMWVGTYMGGIAVLDGKKWTIYNTSNSELPHNYINAIAIDKNNVKWVGTDGGGLASLENETWTVYKTSNSGLPSNVVMSVFCDDDGIVWVGTYFGGLAKFDGENWKIYNEENTPLLSNKVVTITKDKTNVLWLGTQGGGIASFDGTNWNVYNERNSNLPSDYIYSIVSDNENNKWIGTGGGGVSVFNDVFWISYNTKNSDLQDDNIRPIMIDPSDNKWIGTYIGGIHMFKDDKWTKFDFQNSPVPDDEITCFSFANRKLYVGTERSGILIREDKTVVEPLETPEAIILAGLTEEQEGQIEEEIFISQDKPEIVEVPVVVAIPVIVDDAVEELFVDDKLEIKEVAEDEEPVVEEVIIPVEEPIVENIVTPVEQPVVVPEAIVAADIPEGQIEEEIEVSEDAEEKENIQEQVDNVVVPSVEIVIKEETKEIPPATITMDTRMLSKIILVIDAADVYFDQKRLEKYKRSFKLLLNRREQVDITYEVKILVFTSNFDVSPKKIQFTEKELKSLHTSEVVYIAGEGTFSEGIKKAFGHITAEYDPQANNRVIAATYKFIRDDEKAKVIIKENVEENNIIFSLLGFETTDWKMEHKMRNMVPKGESRYYSINPAGILDNWSATFQFGISLFKGDLDVNKVVSFPGVFGFALNKQVLSSGMVSGGIKGQFNFGSLQGEKNNYSFENKYKEGCINFQAILNSWFNRNFRFEKIRPYAFAGIGFINYRTLLRNGDGQVVNGYGYDVIEGDKDYNGSDPEKSGTVTDLMFPLGIGANYKISDRISLELEASSRLINSDKLDTKIRWKNDKYWFFSIGVSYKFRQKEFLSDILTR